MSQPQRSKTMPAAAPTKHLKLSLKDIPCIPPPPPPVPLRLKLLGAGCALLIPLLIPIAFHILPLLIEPVDAPWRFAGGLAACIAWLTAFASCMAVVVMVLIMIEGMMAQLASLPCSKQLRGSASSETSSSSDNRSRQRTSRSRQSSRGQLGA